MAADSCVKPLPGLTSWAGGKRFLARRLGALIDADPHQVYVEPFAGAGHVFFGRSIKRPVEVINDANGELVNVWHCWRRHPDELVRTILATPFSRQEFERLARLDPEHLTDLERAGRMLFMQRARFGGRLDNTAFCASPASVKSSTADRWRARIAAAAERLTSVVIENRDFAWVIRRFDTAETLFYLDPPYWGAEDAYGRGCFGPPDFERLSEALRGLKGRFLMSLNAHPEVRRIFAWASIDTIKTVWSTRKPGRHHVMELLISPPKLGE